MRSGRQEGVRHIEEWATGKIGRKGGVRDREE